MSGRMSASALLRELNARRHDLVMGRSVRWGDVSILEDWGITVAEGGGLGEGCLDMYFVSGGSGCEAGRGAMSEVRCGMRK